MLKNPFFLIGGALLLAGILVKYAEDLDPAIDKWLMLGGAGFLAVAFFVNMQAFQFGRSKAS